MNICGIDCQKKKHWFDTSFASEYLIYNFHTHIRKLQKQTISIFFPNQANPFLWIARVKEREAS
jgi:hypothetical protein